MEPDTQPTTPQSTPSSSNRWGIYVGLLVAVVAVGGLAAWALSGETKDEASNTTTSTSQTDTDASANETATDTPAAAGTATITYTNNGFEPNSLTVKKGTVVTIKNASDTDVKFSSADHPAHRENPEMNTDTIGPGESTTYTANTVGKFGYHDHIDDSKTGSITVTE